MFNSFYSCVTLLQIAIRQYDSLYTIYIYIIMFIYIYISIVCMVGTRLHSGIFYGCVSKSGFCKFHEFPLKLAISRWWLPDLGHTRISSVKRKHISRGQALAWGRGAVFLNLGPFGRLRWKVGIVLVPGLPKLRNSLETHSFRGLYYDWIMNIFFRVWFVRNIAEPCWILLFSTQYKIC